MCGGQSKAQAASSLSKLQHFSKGCLEGTKQITCAGYDNWDRPWDGYQPTRPKQNGWSNAVFQNDTSILSAPTETFWCRE